MFSERLNPSFRYQFSNSKIILLLTCSPFSFGFIISYKNMLYMKWGYVDLETM